MTKINANRRLQYILNEWVCLVKSKNWPIELKQIQYAFCLHRLQAMVLMML